MVVKGKLITCKREVKDFGKRQSEEKLWITLAEAELSKDQQKELEDAFKDAGKNFTPAWVKKFEGYVNVSTQYDLPYLLGKKVAEAHTDIEEKGDSILALIKAGFPYIGADVKLSLNVKEGAVYPLSVKILSEGKPFNPYSEFDDDDED